MANGRDREGGGGRGEGRGGEGAVPREQLRVNGRRRGWGARSSNGRPHRRRDGHPLIPSRPPPAGHLPWATAAAASPCRARRARRAPRPPEPAAGYARSATDAARGNGGRLAGGGLGGRVGARRSATAHQRSALRVEARPPPRTHRPGGPPGVAGPCAARRPAPLPRPPPLPRQPPTAQSRPPEKGALVRAREATGGSRLEQTTPSCCYHCRRRCRRRRCRRHHRSRHSRRRDSRPWRCH